MIFCAIYLLFFYRDFYGKRSLSFFAVQRTDIVFFSHRITPGDKVRDTFNELQNFEADRGRLSSEGAKPAGAAIERAACVLLPSPLINTTRVTTVSLRPSKSISIGRSKRASSGADGRIGEGTRKSITLMSPYNFSSLVFVDHR